jgi:cytochrome c553
MSANMSRILKLLILVAASSTALAGSANGADLNAGASKAKEICQACHGLDGNSSSADYPRIGGQYPDYLGKALRDYKSGARKNPIMAGFAGGLSDRDIDNVAAYYASQPATVATKH